MLKVITTPTILAPTMGQKVSFIDPILIQWDWNPKEILVTKFHLCIGTENGNWDLMNGEVGLFDRFSFVLPPLPGNINHIYIQLLYKTVVNEEHHAEEETFVAGRITVERA